MTRRNQGRWARIGFWMGEVPRELGRGRLILHIDDDRDTNLLYASFLRRAGFRVADARTGVQGVERALELSPALILMDLVMPITDGFEATRRLKHHRQTLHIPILILTAHAYQGPIRLAEQAGANGFLLKPVVSDALLDKIDELLVA